MDRQEFERLTSQLNIDLRESLGVCDKNTTAVAFNALTSLLVSKVLFEINESIKEVRSKLIKE